MNRLAVFLFALAVVAAKPLSEEDEKEMKKIHEECASASGLEEEDILSIYEDGPNDEPKIKEHLYCFLEKLGVIKDGKIQTDAFKEELAKYLGDKDKAEEITAKCAVEKDDHLQTAFDIAQCIHHEKTEK